MTRVPDLADRGKGVGRRSDSGTVFLRSINQLVSGCDPRTVWGKKEPGKW